MLKLYEKALYKLELDQILAQLADCAGSEDGKEACRALMPTSDLEDVNLLLAETTAAVDLCTQKGNPSFAGVKNVAPALDRAHRGGTLHPSELLAIAGVLRCTRTVKSYVSDDDKDTVLDPMFRMLSPNKYLEDKIFGNCRQCKLCPCGYPPPYAHPKRQDQGFSAKGDFLSCLCKITQRAYHHHSAG